ncbi:hypothetical protein G6011_04124 [Alternaria panax]|uniref:Uncharacterized protein n=1 Tax=Alternaria panax TaxID=48097 RepID=A0AAD4IGI1_9PLEO|nr:hypothetical protein G6011_04124 [Alternaria panax]
MFSTVFNTEYIVHLKVCTFLQWALSAIYFKISSALLPPRKPRKPTIVDLLTRYTPVQDIVLAELDIVDIISLSRTTKAFQGYVKLVGGTQFNVDERLKHFVTSPSSFRVLQANHNIIIAGNFAYEFMARKPFGETTGKRQLDGLLAQKGANAAALQCFLESDGFRALDEPSSGISTRPMVDQISTACWQDAENAGLEVLPMIYDDVMVKDPLSKTNVLDLRHIGDAHSWMIQLKKSSATDSSPYPDYLIDLAGFEIVIPYRELSSSFARYSIRTRVIRQLSLRHPYVTCQTTDALRNWLRDVAITSLYHLPVAERPQQLSHLFIQRDIDHRVMLSLEDFTPPSSKWKYYDGEMTNCLRKQYAESKQGDSE